MVHLDPIGGPGGGGVGVARVWSGATLVARETLMLGLHAWPEGVSLVSGFRVAGAPGGNTLVVVHNAGLLFGRANTQYYGLKAGGRPVLLRLESKGKLRANLYQPHGLVGSPPPAWSLESLRDALRGEDPGSILDALNWLGGGPAQGRGPLYDRLARDALVRTTLQELTRSGTGWIAEAAALALERVPKT